MRSLFYWVLQLQNFCLIFFRVFSNVLLLITNFIPELTEFFFPFSSLSLFGICCYSVTKSCLTVWNPKDCSMAGFPILHHLLEFAQIHVHWVGDAIQQLILCHPLLLLPSIFPSIGVFSNESALCVSMKYRSFNFSISSSNEYSGLISFRMDRFDLPAGQGTLKSLL